MKIAVVLFSYTERYRAKTASVTVNFYLAKFTLRQLKVEADQYPKLLPRETRFSLGNFRVLPSLLPGNCRGYQLTFTKRTIDHGTIAGGDTVVSKTFE